MIMDMEREEALKDLKLFQENFKVRDHRAGYPRLFDLASFDRLITTEAKDIKTRLHFCKRTVFDPYPCVIF